MSAPIDAEIRQRALDPTQSFIVQAPAGSGKTELLTRRVLTLLMTVDEPEEVLAITFTRKAASEMRQRVVEMLIRARDNAAVSNPYEAEGLALAQNVLARDQERNWQLIVNSQRLNLRTIDSLATQLAHQLPVTSALGAPTGIVENAYSLYYEVAGRFIEGHMSDLHRVLLHLGNRIELAQRLLAEFLASRDQWKRHVYGASELKDELREILEQMLTEWVESRMTHLCACVPDDLQNRLLPCLKKAFEFLLINHEGDRDALSHEIQCWHSMDRLPGSELADLVAWDSIAFALFTGNSDIRKRLTVKEGFPAKSAAKKLGIDANELEEHKQSMMSVLESVAEATEFVTALQEVRKLPYPRYSDEQWLLLSDLLALLPNLLAELQWMFSERGVVDFVEISERAQRALGSDDEPTDLALSLDLSLKHILVDEFQDTSQTQFRLFEQLVRGWSPSDGRTFFVVGDPMQSIYRFRDGDVALFGQVVEQGIGVVSLIPLTLSVNFRAAPAVIDWVNETFAEVFPKRADPNCGAVPYSPSSAHLSGQGQVLIHPLIDQTKAEEARVVAELAASAVVDDKEHQVAILVRTRGQASDIFASLRAKGLAYQSIDMDLIGDRAVVNDLLTLCLCLRYPHDRLHWLSLLRSPFVGLLLADLHALMDNSQRSDTIIDLLQSDERLKQISADGQARIQRLLNLLKPALKCVSRGHLMAWVECIWLQLGGPVVCKDAIDFKAAESAINRLIELENEGLLWRKKDIANALASLYAPNLDDGESQIQVMTLHKAKGLEFDTVILPALDRQPRADSKQLLSWYESTVEGQPQWLLAPFEQSGLSQYDRDPIIRLVRKAKERGDEQEKLRLLYVACTRAKSTLHLVARASLSSSGQLKIPVSQSLLNPIWPQLEPLFISSGVTQAPVSNLFGEPSLPTKTLQQEQYAADAQQALDASKDSLTNTPLLPSQPFERLPLKAKFPSFSVFHRPQEKQKLSKQPVSVEFSWAGLEARHVGTVVHEQLRAIADSPNDPGDIQLQQRRSLIEKQLQNQGVRKHRLSESCEKVLIALENTLADDRGIWTLTKHQDARSEWAITMPMPNKQSTTGNNRVVENIVIDRTFVDAHGVRWIVDFKTGGHSGSQTEAFLDNEQARYQDQLNKYADIMSVMEDRPIRVGLYFPMICGWREWEPPHN